MQRRPVFWLTLNCRLARDSKLNICIMCYEMNSAKVAENTYFWLAGMCVGWVVYFLFTLQIDLIKTERVNIAMTTTGIDGSSWLIAILINA